MGLEKYVLNGNPMCCAANVVSGEHYRISMLTTALVRLEYSENGEFEDRPTQMVVNRDFAPTEFKVSDVNGELHIYTKDLEIHYDKKEFTPGGLMIRVAGGKSNERVWHYGEAPRDLLGTARTLDEADGAIPLEHGILSKNGFSLLILYISTILLFFSNTYTTPLIFLKSNRHLIFRHQQWPLH